PETSPLHRKLTARSAMPGEGSIGEFDALAGPVRDWFGGAFPGGPTEAQRLAWPLIASGTHLLLISPTGTGKTLAAFLAIIDEMHREHAAGTLTPGLRCVYISPLRSLSYDIERNLAAPWRRSGGPRDGMRAR
ncbi:MAG: DEAD/DEAH box helicase, partial [Singulisphaera sp.]